MFDTMTITKALGGFCGAFLVFLLGGWAAEAIVNGGGQGGHEELERAYSVEVPEVAGAEDAAPVEEGPPFEELFAAADPAAGENAFRACQSCHALEEGVNGTGPSLHGVVGRAVESVPGFDYDGALIAVNDVWTPEEINAFITKPADYAPGTKMTYPGMRDAVDRANLIAYLATNPG